jgi:hypothetical protein
MGARTNFHFKQGDNYVTLYSHWGGDEKMFSLASAIKKAEPRWTDTGYATRIIISNLIGSSWDSETGFGIYADNVGGEESYQHTVIDMDNQLVIVDGHSHSFSSFCEYTLEEIPNNHTFA